MSAERPAAPPTAGLSALRALVDRLGREPAVASPFGASATAGAAQPPTRASGAHPAAEGRSTQHAAAGPVLTALAAGALPPSASLPLLPPPPPRPLKSVQRHDANWRRLRAEQRLLRLRDAVPPQAGPLHSATLVHRALAQMHAVSPAYLEAWLRGVDNLLAVERIAARPRR